MYISTYLGGVGVPCACNATDPNSKGKIKYPAIVVQCGDKTRDTQHVTWEVPGPVYTTAIVRRLSLQSSWSPETH